MNKSKKKKILKKAGYCYLCKKKFLMSCLILKIIKIEGITKGITICDSCDKL